MNIAAVIKRLAFFGYTATAADNWNLKFLLGKVEAHIRNFCHIKEIPEGLWQVAVDMAVAEFLREKKAQGLLDMAMLAESEAVKEIRDGDTTVTFANSSSLSFQLDEVLKQMLDVTSDLIRFRRMAR